MTTKDCIAAINAQIDSSIDVYEGDRNFKLVSESKNDQGVLERIFEDNLFTFRMTGDAPPYYMDILFYEDSYIPQVVRDRLRAANQANVSIQQTPPPAPVVEDGAANEVQRDMRPWVKAYFEEDDGVYTLVMRDYWEKHRRVDPDADFSAMIPNIFTHLEGPRYRYDGDFIIGADALISANIDPQSLSDKPMGKGWQFALFEYEKGEEPSEDDDKCCFYLVRHGGDVEDMHLDYYFPHLPDEIGEVNESLFASDWDGPTTRQWLLDNGFTTTRELTRMIYEEMGDPDTLDDEDE